MEERLVVTQASEVKAKTKDDKPCIAGLVKVIEEAGVEDHGLVAASLSAFMRAAALA